MRYKIVVLFLVLLLLTPMISSCTKSYSTILEDATCRPPCWKNIHPGITKVDDAVHILEDMEEVHFPPSFYETDFNKGEGFFTLLFNARVYEFSGMIYFHDNLVTKIEFDTEKITLGDIVDKLGNPEQFLAVSGWADTKWLNIYLIYPNGVIVTFFKSNIMWVEKGLFDLKDNMKVFSILYFDPELYNEVLKTDVLNRSVYDNAILIDNIQEWHGFGLIEYYDP